MSTTQRIYNYCIHLLARQDYSEFKLRQKLRSKKNNLPHEIDEAVEKLKAKGLLHEENYKRLFIKKWLQKGESPMKIRMRGKAEKLNFSEEDFQQFQTEEHLSKTVILQQLIQKKMRNVPSDLSYEDKQSLKQKTFRFLMGKGYSYEESNQAIKLFLA